jgi:hypothetical protein
VWCLVFNRKLCLGKYLHVSMLQLKYALFYTRYSRTVTIWGKMLTTHLHLMQQLSMTKATPLLPLHLRICTVYCNLDSANPFHSRLCLIWADVLQSKSFPCSFWWSWYDIQTVTWHSVIISTYSVPGLTVRNVNTVIQQ